MSFLFLIEKAFPAIQKARFGLDLGCGDGQVMALLRSHMPDDLVLTGIDIDPMETELAEQTGLYDKVLCSSASAIPLPEESQDFIVSNSVLEHIQPIGDVLKEASRVLKKEGLFIATVPSVSFHDCLKGAWLPHISKEKYNKAIDKRLAHFYYWSAKEWGAHLEKVGIAVEHCLPYLTEKQVQRWEFLSRLTGGLLYNLQGKKERPITIQRTMGMRRGVKIPSFLAKMMAWLCTVGLSNGVSEKHGCVLVIGKKV